MNILLVDDDEVDRLSVARALRSAGLDANLQEAGSVAAAVSALGATPFDCVLLDYQLPGGDGLDVLRALKEGDTGTPVIILTAHGDEQTAVEFMKAGASDYLPKSSLSADRLAQSLRYATDRRELERERDQLLIREQQARGEAEEANAAKDLFLATVSHELRTPMNAILGWARMLRDRTLDADRVEHGLAVIERNANLQQQLINDLLDVSRIISGKLELQIAPVDPVRICEAAVDAMQPQIEAKHITIKQTLDEDAGLIPADAVRLQQVICNLLSNAIKFSSDGGAIELQLRCNGSAVEIAVIDHGRGIPADFLPRIFDQFSQARRADHGFKGGLGLGLAIARNLVELHGGILRADSAGEGLGASFVVELPTESPDRQTSMAVHETPPAVRTERLEGIRVLFIDDNADARDLVATILSDRGARVRTCDSTTSALMALQRERPDVVISDIEMPDGDGYQMIRALRLRDADTEAPIPAIALTGVTRPEDRIRMFASGFQVHVPKPIDSEELVAAVAALAAQCRGHRPAARARHQ